MSYKIDLILENITLEFITGGVSTANVIVIAIGDDYRFAFFGLVTKLWLKFQGLFY